MASRLLKAVILNRGACGMWETSGERRAADGDNGNIDAGTDTNRLLLKTVPSHEESAVARRILRAVSCPCVAGRRGKGIN